MTAAHPPAACRTVVTVRAGAARIRSPPMIAPPPARAASANSWAQRSSTTTSRTDVPGRTAPAVRAMSSSLREAAHVTVDVLERRQAGQQLGLHRREPAVEVPADADQVEDPDLCRLHELLERRGDTDRRGQLGNGDHDELDEIQVRHRALTDRCRAAIVSVPSMLPSSLPACRSLGSPHARQPAGRTTPPRLGWLRDALGRHPTGGAASCACTASSTLAWIRAPVMRARTPSRASVAPHGGLQAGEAQRHLLLLGDRDDLVELRHALGVDEADRRAVEHDAGHVGRLPDHLADPLVQGVGGGEEEPALESEHRDPRELLVVGELRQLAEDRRAGPPPEERHRRAGGDRDQPQQGQPDPEDHARQHAERRGCRGWR